MGQCPEAKDVAHWYSYLSAAGMILYFMLTIDLAVFSTRISAFVLACSRVLSEVGLFIFGLLFFILTFACAINGLDQKNEDFDGVHEAALTMLKITFGMYSGEAFTALTDPALFIGTVLYIIITTVDMIRRFGGTTSPAAQWPEDDQANDDEEDRFERIERLMEKAMKQVSRNKKTKQGGVGSSQGQSGTGQTESSSGKGDGARESGSDSDDNHD